MPKYVIERELPGAGQLTPQQLQAVSQTSCGVLRKLAHRTLLTCGDHEVFRLTLLQHQPLCAHIIACMAPITPRIQIAKVQRLLKSDSYARQGAGDLARNKRFTSHGRFVVEEYSAARK